MKKTKLLLAFLMLTPIIGYSQPWTSSGSNVRLVNLGDYVGIGTTSPTFSGNRFEVSQGGVMFQSTQGGRVRFENPNLEEGMAIFTNTAVVPGTTLYRSDIRLNNTGLKIGCTQSTAPTIPSAVPGSNLMYITPFGRFGLGYSAPGHRLDVAADLSGSNFGVNIEGNSATSVTEGILNVTETGIPSATTSYGPFGLIAMRTTADNACGAYIFGKNYGTISRADQGANSTAIKAEAGQFAAMNAANIYTGVLAKVLRAGTVYGFKADVGDAIQCSNVAYGGRFEAQGFTTYGVYGKAIPACGLVAAYGVYGEAPTLANSYAGYFNGNAYVNGTTSGVGYLFASDQKFKKDIEPLKNGLDIINKLNPTTYNFRTDDYKFINFPTDKQYGFIAQELEKVLPEAVKTQTIRDDKDEKFEYKAVNYIELIPVLTKAIQEQQTQIDAQQKQIEELKASLANNSGNNTTGIANDQNNDQGSLSQNVPNPFSQNTVIGYKLPLSAKTAAIGVYDLNGKELKLVTLGAETTGSITIEAGTMPAGMYVYTLIVNGNPFATKKMILTSH